MDVILVGDTSVSLWERSPNDLQERVVFTVLYQLTWEEMRYCVVLREVMWHPWVEQATFHDTLVTVAVGRAGHTEWNLLRTRMKENISGEEIYSFYDGVDFFPANDVAGLWNFERLHHLDKPVARNDGEHIFPRGVSANPDCDRGLLSRLFVAAVAHVFLDNIWTKVGLSNGAMETVVHINWVRGQRPQRYTPGTTVLPTW